MAGAKSIASSRIRPRMPVATQESRYWLCGL